ncbi:MAG: response regulator transcription factor [Verrucomicrobia bacterium]|nr:response regulator transcription factor [Verrucomicrobiota bacterium]
MSKIQILLAEDDQNIRLGLMDTLESEGYAPTPATDGQQALALFKKGKYDLVILDVMMPRMSGYDVCREIRARDATVPIIMLTAKGEEIDKVVGLQLGADDYVTKPFGIHELLARIAAALRRARVARERPAAEASAAPPARFTFGVAEIDRPEYRARCGKKVFDLTSREVELICFFKAHPNVVLSRDDLLNAVWGIEYYGTTRTLDQHIAQLRKKVESDPKSPTVIQTVHGVGYRYCC